MANIKERLDKVRSLIKDKDFLLGKGLSNEVNIRIFCYDVEDEMTVRHFLDQMSNDSSLGCNLRICNLYDMFLEVCDDMGITEEISEMEKNDEHDWLLNQLNNAIGHDCFIAKLQEKIGDDGNVIMLTGVGEVYPFMRVHSLLEAMQPYFPDIPILVMYPGEFNGRQLKLFNRLTPNDYYRAFNVI